VLADRKSGINLTAVRQVMTNGSVLGDCVIGFFPVRHITAIAADQIIILNRKGNGSRTDGSGRDGGRSRIIELQLPD
jgi:hypothetical protein